MVVIITRLRTKVFRLEKALVLILIKYRIYLKVCVGWLV